MESMSTVGSVNSIDNDDTRLEKIISDDTRRWFEIINYFILCSTVAMFGIISNIINIIVFCKQGFQNTMNISFTALAICDLCSLVILQWFNICLGPLNETSELPLAASEFQYLTAGWPRTCFGRITIWITVYITAERCLCIAFPLKIKQMITSTKVTVILVLIYFFNVLTLVPDYATAYISWKFDPQRNQTLLGLVYHGDRVNMLRLSFLLHAVLSIMAFGAVVVLTIILAVVLKRKTNWRQKAMGKSGQADSVTARDKKTVVMVGLIATFLIIFYTPTSAFSLTSFFVPEVSITGQYFNLFMVIWSTGFLCEALNSSINIFVYYKMSSRYRETFQKMFPLCCKTDAQLLSGVHYRNCSKQTGDGDL